MKKPRPEVVEVLWTSLLCAALIILVACLSAGVGRGAPAPLPRKKPPPVKPAPAIVVGEWHMTWRGCQFSVVLHAEGGYECGNWKGVWLYDARRHCLHVEEYLDHDQPPLVWEAVLEPCPPLRPEEVKGRLAEDGTAFRMERKRGGPNP